MIKVERLTKYDKNIAADIGKLLPSLSSGASSRPIDKAWLETVIKSPFHDQIVAFDGNKLVGTATVSIVMSTTVGHKAYLEDFVVDSTCQGKGIGSLIWNDILAWGREKGAKHLDFTSSGRGKKSGAVQFYLKKGATIRQTNCFRVEF